MEVLKETDLNFLGPKKAGKVRDRTIVPMVGRCKTIIQQIIKNKMHMRTHALPHPCRPKNFETETKQRGGG